MTEPTAERPRKRRRFLKWIVIAFLLSPIWYVAAWLMAGIAWKRMYIPPGYVPHVVTLFRPLMAYADSEMYGADLLQRAFCKLHWDDVSYLFSKTEAYLATGDDRMKLGPFSPWIRLWVYRSLAKVNNTPSPLTEASADSDWAKHGEKP
ncbi:MAG: hypothetical protein U0992_21980 [Planctomycetaceae bacterium]